MLDLHSITLSNFRSYRGQHTFEFPTETGLYFFTGKNLSEPKLSSNGAGKSTLLDAIVWALYGRTTRGLKANEAISWGAASCQVSLELTVGNERLTIKRTQKPNNLYLGDKPVDQKELEKHIRLNYESFTYSVINTQFGESFLALSPSAKLTLFSEIMGLDYWLERSEEAAKLAKELEAKISNLQNLIARHEGQLVTVKDDITSLQQDSDNYAYQQELKISAVKRELCRTTNDLIVLDAEIVDFPRPDLKPLIKARDIVLDEITANARAHAEHSGELKRINEERQEYKFFNGRCPTCNQKIDKAPHEARLECLAKEALLIELSIDTIKSAIDESKKRLVNWNNKIDTAIDQVNELKEKKAERATATGKANQLSATRKELASQANPHAAMLQAKKASLKELKTSIAKSKQGKAALEAGYEAVSFWIKGFKRVRLFLIEQAFRTLELEVNNSLSQLGMGDWQISFDVERENKSGGVTKGFVVFVQSPANEEPVKWESWSGGETQRLQLAGDLGLANLIMQQAGLSNTTEFYDEPSTHLSPEGMMDLANMLHERAVNESKRIWIVDHTSITNFGEFIGIIIARKDENGSTINYNS